MRWFLLVTTVLLVACNGSEGERGPQGEPGQTGPQGAIGPQGPQGEPGSVGTTGPQGPRGEQGPIGPKGDPGTNGTNGANGVNGNDGVPCWDLDGSGSCDVATEDKNDDDACTVADCRGERGPSGVAGFCGASTPTTGLLGSYAGAKTICETTCGTATAHMCSGHELILSFQNGNWPPNPGWYMSGSFVGGDCSQWQNDQGTGAYWTGSPSTTDCGELHAVLCCD